MNKNIYSYDLSIDIISEQSGISGKYFRTLFKKFYGISRFYLVNSPDAPFIIAVEKFDK